MNLDSYEHQKNLYVKESIRLSKITIISTNYMRLINFTRK